MSDVVFLVACVVSLFYLILILLLSIGIKKMKDFQRTDTVLQNSFSIIVPFRNESDYLGTFLESLKKLHYPSGKFEVILVNDASTDTSVQIVESFIMNHPAIQIKLLHNDLKAISPKKEALEKAIKIAQFEWIITTDADCIVPELWLQTINEFIEVFTCDMIVAPVTFTTDHTFLQDFQQLDFFSLMGATQGGFGIGSPFLCNGANLCYKKSVFELVNGFEGNNSIASGDDIFLMEKFLKLNPSVVKYLKSKDAIVQTRPQMTLKDLVNQRIRWASKTTAYKNITGKLVGIVVLSMNFLLFTSFIFLYFRWISLSEVLLLWLMKLILDYLLLRMIAIFYQFSISKTAYLIFSFIYSFYTVLIGFLSFRKKYEWKGRKF